MQKISWLLCKSTCYPMPGRENFSLQPLTLISNNLQSTTFFILATKQWVLIYLKALIMFLAVFSLLFKKKLSRSHICHVWVQYNRIQLGRPRWDRKGDKNGLNGSQWKNSPINEKLGMCHIQRPSILTMTKVTAHSLTVEMKTESIAERSRTKHSN